LSARNTPNQIIAGTLLSVGVVVAGAGVSAGTARPTAAERQERVSADVCNSTPAETAVVE
jgi:hypothetical protein